MNITAVIIEDEPRSARYLQRQLEKENIECLTILGSVEEALCWFEANKHPDIVFSDIELGDGLSFDIYNQIQVTSKIIFTTAYNQYSIQAFKHNSLDYLLKPIKNSDLIYALNQFNNSELSNYNVAVEKTPSYKNILLHKVGNHLKTIKINELSYLFSENKLVYFVLNNKEKIVTDYTLENAIKELNPKYFFRINRQMIINKNAILDILILSSTRFELKLSPEYKGSVIISRDRIKDFKQWLES